MRDIIIQYYKTQQISIQDAIKLLEEYMRLIGKTNPALIQHMLDPMNVFGQPMLQQAVQVSVQYLEGEYNIVKLFSKENVLLNVY
jgi:hypothetical protein